MAQPVVTCDGENFYKVKGKPEIPDLLHMDRLGALIWLNRHTYPRGYSKPNPLAGLAGVISLDVR